jgi:hypothetical protein
LQNSKHLDDFEFKISLTRGLQEAGFNINEDGNDVTQLTIMAKHLQRLNEKGNIVYDRCALDGLAYSRVLLDEGNILTAISLLFSEMIERYDIIFYVVPELPLVEDGQRTINRDFFNDVVSSFDFIIENYNVPVIRISGTVEERVKQVLQAIEDFEALNLGFNLEDKFYEL